jgi:hypothetical protein
MRPIVLVFCLLAATGCDEKAPAGPTGPTVPINQQFTLAPGEAAVIEGTGLRVQFMRVLGDSRCPADALCIWIGDATVHVRIFEGTATSDYDLHTANSQQSTIEHGGTRVSLVQLQPYPFSSRTIQPSDYRATLDVRR